MEITFFKARWRRNVCTPSSTQVDSYESIYNLSPGYFRNILSLVVCSSKVRLSVIFGQTEIAESALLYHSYIKHHFIYSNGMGRRIDPSWWTHWVISRSSQCSTTGIKRPWYVLFCLWDDAGKRPLPRC